MVGSFRHGPAGTRLLSAIGAHEQALRLWADRQADGRERTRAAERLDAIGEMRTAVIDGDLGRAASFLNGEERAIGWQGYHGPGGDAVHETFRDLVEALRQARLEGQPDAGFGH